MKLQFIVSLLFVTGAVKQALSGQQSPVNLRTLGAIPSIEITPLQLSVYQEDPAQVTVEYDGYTFVYRFEYPDGQNVTARGGPLRGTYQMDNIHFHWGPNSSVGAEHLIDGFRYAMEMHIEFFDQQYGSIEEAQSQSDGLFTLAIFFSPTTRAKQTPEPDYEWISALDKIPEVNTIYTLPDPAVFNIERLIGPNRTPYFSYPGSMTRPPYYETVIWAVEMEPLPIAERQLDTFRSPALIDADILLENGREVMSIHLNPTLAITRPPITLPNVNGFSYLNRTKFADY